MLLTNGNAQEMIAKCLFGSKWKEFKQFVLPRKGNFLNPQYLTDTNTYVVYYITAKNKKTTGFSITERGEENAAIDHYVPVQSHIDLQFIGLHAEEWANSVLFWDERLDVQEVFNEYDCQLFLGDRNIDTVPFQQEGYNGELSYLASFSVVQSISKEEVKEYWTDPIIFLGNLKVEK